MTNMDSYDISELWQANNKSFSRQHQDDTEWEIAIMENHELLRGQLQTNAMKPLDIADVTSYYGIYNVIQ